MICYISLFMVGLAMTEAQNIDGQSAGVSPPPNVPPTCGIFGARPRKPTSQNINDKFLVPKEIQTVPYEVLIGATDGNTEYWICMGILINDQWLVTAAQCVINSTLTNLRLRVKDLDNPLTAPGKEPLNFDIAEVFIHPEYTINKYTNDLALIRMSTRVPIEKNQYDIVPYCLAWGEDGTGDFVGTKAYAAGRNIDGNTVSPLNRKGLMNVLTAQDCLNIYKGNLENPMGNTKDDIICLESYTPDTGFCNIMTGSGTGYINENGQVVLIAMATAGVNPCPLINQPMYAKKHLEWIKSIAF